MQEREVKLLLDPRARLPEPAVLFDGIADWSVETVEQDAVYFDTADLALARAGASLRFRSDDGWTVKIPRPRVGDALVRDEHSIAGVAGAPPAAATDLVLAWTRSRPVLEVARVHTARRRFVVVDGTGHPLVEVDDDTVTTEDRDGRTTRFHEVEIEARSNADGKQFDDLLHRLRLVGVESADGMPKVVRALGPRAQAPPDLVVPSAPAADATLARLARFAIARSVQRLVDHDPVVRVSDDPEGVHQARVATRRLRSDLRTLAPTLDESWSEPLRAELRWMGEHLGRVRDADVLLERLEAEVDWLSEAEHGDARQLLDRLRAQRARDRDDLLAAMRGARYARLLDALVDAAMSPRVRDALAEEPARLHLAALLERSCKRLRKAVRRLPDEPADADLHEVRKRAKQARYAFEALTPIAGRRAARAARRLADLQEVLGDHQDTVVAEAWLHAAAADTDRPELAFAAGRLAASFADERRARRVEWPTIWKRARRAMKKAQARAGA
ncbi:MAG TPA: CYTH and CHAD domain-containing protein [Acidimicrobiia bacterium]|nr:CYTH and CHAD domain-containing protein [Acidimicrobiia bacterium]